MTTHAWMLRPQLALTLCLLAPALCTAAEPTTAPVTAPATGPSTAPTTVSTTGPTTAPATVAIHRGDLSLSFDVSGYLEPIDSFEARYRPKVFAGELTIVSLAPDGASVKAGDVLLALDPTQLQKQVTATENDVQAGAAGLAKVEADAKLYEQMAALELRQQQDATREAADAVKWWENVDGPQMLARLDLNLKAAQAGVDDQTDELDQLRKMYKADELTNATADIVVKRAVRALEVATKQLEMSKQRADEARQVEYPIAKQRVQDALTSAKYALEQLQISQTAAKVTREAGLVAARAGFAASQQHLADLKQDLGGLTIKAPFAGTVAWGAFGRGSFTFDARALQPGERVLSGQVMLTLLAPGKLRAVGDLPEARVGELPAGAPVTVLPTAFPELRIAGACTPVLRTPVASQSGAVYPLAVNLEGVDPRLAAGNHVTMHVDAPLAKAALLAPISAVVGGKASVRSADGKIESRKVVTGPTDGVSIVVEQGLTEGDAVLVHPEL